jgi:hypothetical protein
MGHYPASLRNARWSNGRRHRSFQTDQSSPFANSTPIGVKRGVGYPVARARWRRCFAFSLAFLLFARIVLLDLAVFFTWGSDLHGIGHFLADILNGGHRLSAGLRCHYRKRLPQPLAIALADLISHCRQLGGHILRPPSGLHRSSSSPTDKSRRLVMPSRCQGLAFRLRP